MRARLSSGTGIELVGNPPPPVDSSHGKVYKTYRSGIDCIDNPQSARKTRRASLRDESFDNSTLEELEMMDAV
jgi:hypothetical protein